MKKLTISTVAATVVALLALAGTAGAAAPKKIAFTGTYTGNATTKMSGGSGQVSASGTGSGTLIGASKLSGSGQVQQAQPCALWGGPGEIAGAKAKLSFLIPPSAQGCGSEDSTDVSISGIAAVKSGSGAFSKAKGSLKFTGMYDRGTGAFRVTFRGTLTT